MLLSFIVYTITALLLFVLGRNVANRESYTLSYQKSKLTFGSIEIIFSILIFAFIAGARYHVGIDHLNYLKSYLHILNFGEVSGSPIERGFLLISKSFASLDLHYFFYFAFWGALQIGFVYYAFRNNKKLLCYIGLLIMLGPYFLTWMNGIRQCVVACAFIFIVEFAQKKQFWHYVVAIIIATTIHSSAIILLPLYFLLRKQYDLSNRKINLVVLFICVFLGNNPSWIQLLDHLKYLLSFIGYEGYGDNISYWLTEGIESVNWGPSRITIFLAELFVIWFYPQLKEYFKDDKKIRLYFMLFFIGTCSYNLLANTSYIFLRPVDYFTEFRLPMCAYLLCFLMSKSKYLLFYIFLSICCSYIYIAVIKEIVLVPSNEARFSTYKFFWDYLNI